MGVISGQITDELGEPIAGVWVAAIRSMRWQNRRTDIDNLRLITSAGWSAAGQIVTEDGSVPGFPPTQARVGSQLVYDARAERASVDSMNEDWTFSITRDPWSSASRGDGARRVDGQGHSAQRPRHLGGAA
jgi:hypothetical protein